MNSLYTRIPGGVGAAQGFLTSAVSCGIKNPDSPRLDLALIYSETPCSSAGTFTINQVKAAPVRVSQTHLAAGDLRAIVANSGNANACTGALGITDAHAMCDAVAGALALRREEIGVASTGVIGLPMPMMRLTPHFPALVRNLGPDHGADVANAIITSDTHSKEVAISLELDGHTVRIGGCVKGAGMISPSMATMLCFITTDANIPAEMLREFTTECVNDSFNRITIDGDMSTNDTVIVLANGASGMPPLTGEAAETFHEALRYVLLELAKAVVRDGERVTKFVTVQVTGARNDLDAKKATEAVCKSALVKSSWNGGDPNWGRIIHAVGYSAARVREETVDIYIGGKPACIGGLQAETPMDELREVVANAEFEIVIDLNQGEGTYIMYSSDLSPEYVDFNRSEYAYWKQARKDGLV